MNSQISMQKCNCIVFHQERKEGGSGGGCGGAEFLPPSAYTGTQCSVIAESRYWGSVGKHEAESKTPVQTTSLLISSLEIPPLLLLLDLLIWIWNKVAQVWPEPSFGSGCLPQVQLDVLCCGADVGQKSTLNCCLNRR